MTPSQSARLIGINASLSQRGVTLKVQPDGPFLCGLVQELEPIPGQFIVSPNTRSEVYITFLREAGSAAIAPGDSLVNPETNASFRVSALATRPNDIVIRLRCEVAFQ